MIEKWKNRSSSAGGHLMTIMPECPPDEKSDREELHSKRSEDGLYQDLH